ncbi:uncharacterized protein LOC122400888 [Colletes gigas]|uniref:uncharacterized protein LOC122400888 n=1 Tax=Colletes gigas TaxID=935657 RepID=UPI001C9A89CE|nr:uncharacterized protein LOC122400888 [Colletes gigas]
MDTCSNANFITEEIAMRLRLPCKQTSVAIEALNELNTITSRLVSATIRSRVSTYQRTLTFHIISKISGPLPNVPIDRSNLTIPSNIKLADPNFHQPAAIDMLIGTGTTLSSLSIGQIDLSQPNGSDLVLQKTQLGWIVGGSVPIAAPQSKRSTFLTSLDFEMRRFWEVEEGSNAQHLSSEERECEEHFSHQVRRDASGRYIVALPFNEQQQRLGGSRSRALHRLFSLERKFDRNPTLKADYAAVLDEYRALGHMTQVESFDSPGFYLPHHAVIKPSSSTTKVRVVFDGSAKSSSGLSLNDALMTGPTLQDDLFSLLLRFRLYAYVLTGDIEKMYRQFLVRPEDRSFQRILWRDQRNRIATYELNTVTFGLTSAPYLATRCLQQLATDEQMEFPIASLVIKRDMYVDDLLTGANTIEEANELQTQILGMLQRGGLNIRQWASNEPRLLTGLGEDQIHPKILGDSSVMKTLGITWDARNDSISYFVESPTAIKPTKRSILSTIAKIFDPLGLLGPVVITAKIIMQRLWQLNIDWDESLPASIHTEWTTFFNQLQHLNNVSFVRNVVQRNSRQVELHGFCDASERAYGACIYVRSIDNNGHVETNLLCAKSRVAPLKTITLARLELCGAALLAVLYTTVRAAILHQIDKTILWTDSTIVLNWINKQPCTLKTFVANRVSDIQQRTEVTSWRHINSEDNPADVLSRGQTPRQFEQRSNWLHGPEWLSTSEENWPPSKFLIQNEVPELKQITCLIATTKHDDEILQRYSCIRKLRRITAYVLRFGRRNRRKGSLTVEELQEASSCLIRLLQATAFPDEIRQLGNKGNLPSNSKLLPLNPFLDDQGIIRVGGRLQNSTLTYARKHPILLPKGHHITDLIIRDTHRANHHEGITSTLNSVRQAYWPIDGRNATRKVVRQCVRCFRFRPPSTDYIMGNLPASRVTENRPFFNSGVD